MSYYYAKEGQARGPVSVAELSEMAASGAIKPADLVNRVGDSSWIAASEVSELAFPEISAVPPLPTVPPLPGAAAVPLAATPAAPATPLPGGPGMADQLKAASAAAWAKARPLAGRVMPLVNRGIDFAAQFMGLDRIKVIPILLGAAGLLLVLLSTLLVWWSSGQTMNLMGITNFGEHERWRGISYVEGKLVFMAVIGALVAVGLGSMKKEWLPPGLLIAAAAGTFALVLLFGLRRHLKDAASKGLGDVAQMQEMFLKISPDVVKSMDQQVYVSVGWGLTLGVLGALGAAAAWVVAGVFVPQPLAVFADKGQLFERYSALIGSQILAFLAGVMLVVWRY